MTQYENLIEKAKERGYEKHHVVKDANDEVIRYNFIKFNGLGLILYPKTGEFTLYYNLDLLTKIEIEKCSPFMMDEHFKQKEKTIEKYINALKLTGIIY